jgi:hypothetical protein
MIANWVKETISAGGTGNLTLSGAATAHITVNTGMGLNVPVLYSAEDGNNREVGIGHLTTSTNFVRDTVLETLSSGTLDRTSPAALNLSTSTIISINASSQAFAAAGNGSAYPAGGLTGFHSMGLVSQDNSTVALTTSNRWFFPMWWIASKLVTQIGVECTTGATSAVARVGIYARASSGKPGILIKDFTDASTIDVSTSGIKVATPTAGFWLPSGFYYICIHTSTGSPSFSSPHSVTRAPLFLGTTSAGVINSAIFRVVAYGALSSDESGNSFTESPVAVPFFIE